MGVELALKYTSPLSKKDRFSVSFLENHGTTTGPNRQKYPGQFANDPKKSEDAGG